MNNTEVIQKINYLVPKWTLKNIFDTMLNTFSSLEELDLDLLKKCLSSTQPTFLALGNNIHKKPLKKMS